MSLRIHQSVHQYLPQHTDFWSSSAFNTFYLQILNLIILDSCPCAIIHSNCKVRQFTPYSFTPCCTIVNLLLVVDPWSWKSTCLEFFTQHKFPNSCSLANTAWYVKLLTEQFHEKSGSVTFILTNTLSHYTVALKGSPDLMVDCPPIRDDKFNTMPVSPS